MQKYIKKYLAALIATVLLFNIQACSNMDKTPSSNIEKEDTEKVNSNDADDPKFDSSKTILENVDILNNLLETKFGKSLSLISIEDFEKTASADWTLILGDEKVAVDGATWKYNFDSDSDDGKYMDAVLTTFIFFYGEEMGNSLWSLSGDLFDGGADESVYGFTHEGGKAIYKDGRTAAYEPGMEDNFYIWLTPEDTQH